MKFSVLSIKSEIIKFCLSHKIVKLTPFYLITTIPQYNFAQMFEKARSSDCVNLIKLLVFSANFAHIILYA